MKPRPLKKEPGRSDRGAGIQDTAAPPLWLLGIGGLGWHWGIRRTGIFRGVRATSRHSPAFGRKVFKLCVEKGIKLSMTDRFKKKAMPAVNLEPRRDSRKIRGPEHGISAISISEDAAVG